MHRFYSRGLIEWNLKALHEPMNSQFYRPPQDNEEVQDFEFMLKGLRVQGASMSPGGEPGCPRADGMAGRPPFSLWDPSLQETRKMRSQGLTCGKQCGRNRMTCEFVPRKDTTEALHVVQRQAREMVPHHCSGGLFAHGQPGPLLEIGMVRRKMHGLDESGYFRIAAG